MKSVDDVARGLVFLVAMWIVIPLIWHVLQALLPMIFMLLGVVVVVKAIQGRFGKW
jgi:uncharacterized membrane protein